MFVFVLNKIFSEITCKISTKLTTKHNTNSKKFTYTAVNLILPLYYDQELMMDC